MPLAEFECAISGKERPQTHVLDGVTTGVGPLLILLRGKLYVDEHFRITCRFRCTRIETLTTLAQTPISIE